MKCLKFQTIRVLPEVVDTILHTLPAKEAERERNRELKK